MACVHEQFKASVKVGRLSKDDGGPVTGYTAEVTVECAQCGLPFRFLGVAAGSHYAEPRVSIDGQELRAPIEPAKHQVYHGAGDQGRDRRHRCAIASGNLTRAEIYKIMCDYTRIDGGMAVWGVVIDACERLAGLAFERGRASQIKKTTKSGDAGGVSDQRAAFPPLLPEPNAFGTRRYSVKEIDALRECCANWFDWGFYRGPNERQLLIGHPNCHGATPGDRRHGIEEVLRTHMLAGHTAEDLIKSEKEASPQTYAPSPRTPLSTNQGEAFTRGMPGHPDNEMGM